MLKIVFNRWVIGIAVFVAVRMVLGEIFDLTIYCSDGWRSPSIGRSGACSYHGGVDASAFRLANLVSLVVGMAALIGYAYIEENGFPVPSEKNPCKGESEKEFQLEKEELKTEKPNENAQDFLRKNSYALDTKLAILSQENRLEIFGDCIKCGVRFRWAGPTIELELRQYKQMTINEMRGKVKCPDCGSVLHFGYIQTKSEP